MVSNSDIQNAYNKVYAEIRKYIWDFSVVASLTDLEIAIYKTCQDLSDIRTKYKRLRSLISFEIYSDDDLKDAMDYLESLINENDVYVKLNKVTEVIQQ